ncbi:MAG TPA: hypothetical protein VE621_12465 [Bryobacteraceae bacterium]|nr:hypothetical protein [Bryobacteraceae bacterium]
MTQLAYFLLAIAVTGTWEGMTNDLPSVELNLRQQGTRVAGTIGFYFQTRGADGKWRLGPKSELELLSPKMEGKILTFETTHPKRHNSPELGPNNRYRVEFVSNTEARLRMFKGGEPDNDSGPGLRLTRRQ